MGQSQPRHIELNGGSTAAVFGWALAQVTWEVVFHCTMFMTWTCFYIQHLSISSLCTASVNGRKDKSLRVMSQKFVMLFLVSTPQVVNLEVAAKLLIREDHAEYLDKSKFKSKCVEK